MPLHAVIRHVGMQGTTLNVWAEVDPNRPVMKHTFLIYGTGHPIEHDPDEADFIATVMDPRGLVWHVFDAGERIYSAAAAHAAAEAAQDRAP
jgi:hypothetical protein